MLQHKSVTYLGSWSVGMTAVLRRGVRGPEVVRLQQLLNLRLVPPAGLATDGEFGARTEQAVRAFQVQHRLSVDGIAGALTWQALEQGGPAAVAAVEDPRWLSVARAEIGVREQAGAAHNPRILQYHSATSLRATTDETAWCASFVNWCLRQSGFLGTNSALAASFTSWGRASSAVPGAICVIHNSAAAGGRLTTSGNHVAFLIEETASHYLLLGGNQSDSVKISSFRKGLWSLRAMRWPLQ